MNLNPFQRKAIRPEAKNISIGELDQFMRWTLDTRQGGGGTYTISQLRRSVPWLFRGIDTIAQKVSDFPFEIQNDAGDVIDASNDWQNVLEFTNDFRQLLFKLSASLNLHGCAYVKPMANRLASAQGVPSELRYWVAQTIMPVITETNGLEYFERKTGTRPPIKIAIEDLIYLWLPDPDVELGVPLAYPAQAALNAAGVLFSLDAFFKQHAESGLVKAFIAAVKGAPPFGSEQGAAVKDKIEDGLNRDLGGQRNAGKIRAINADTVSITAIGEGLKELENVALTDEKRADIAVALNIPATYIWSGDAGGIGGAGVSKEDTYRLMDNNIVPAFNFIAAILNEQLFSDLGYKLVGLPETLDVFQEDDVARSQASAAYASMISADPVAAKFVMEYITSIDLDEEAEAELDALIADKQANADKMAEALQNKPPVNPNDPNTAAKSFEAGQFKRYAEKHPDKVGSFKFAYHDAEEADTLLRPFVKAAEEDVQWITVNGQHIPISAGNKLSTHDAKHATIAEKLKVGENAFIDGHSGIVVKVSKQNRNIIVPHQTDPSGASSYRVDKVVTVYLQNTWAQTEKFTFRSTGETTKAIVIESLSEYKALPPTDARAVDEAALREQIAAVLAKQLNQVAANINKGQAINYQDLTQELRIELQEGLASIAAQQLTRQSDAIGISYDPAAIDLAAHEWAKRYAYSLVGNLDDKSQAVIQNAVTLYTEAQGMTLGDLKDKLRPAFGDTRADAIAVTETTRAYSQAQNIYKDLLSADGVEMERVWHTDHDDIVCPICRPLNNKTESEWAQDFPEGAPAHVHCRCMIGLRMKR